MSAGELVDVHLLEMPVDVWARAQEHSNELEREFALMSISAASDGPGGTVPARLLSLMQRLRLQYAAQTTTQEQRLLAAHDQDVAVLDDLVYRVPPAVADACLEVGATFDEADAYCREGKHLLTLTTPDDLVAFRQWFLGEFVQQVRGGQPTPWSGHPAQG